MQTHLQGASATAGGLQDDPQQLVQAMQQLDLSNPGQQDDASMQSLMALSAQLAKATARVTKVRKTEGDASVTMVRGRKRYLFDLTVELDFEAEVEDLTGTAAGAAPKSKYKGSMKLDEVSSLTNLSEVEFSSVKYKKALPAKHKARVESIVDLLKKDILEQRLQAFQEHFQREF